MEEPATQSSSVSNSLIYDFFPPYDDIHNTDSIETGPQTLMLTFPWADGMWSDLLVLLSNGHEHRSVDLVTTAGINDVCYGLSAEEACSVRVLNTFSMLAVFE